MASSQVTAPALGTDCLECGAAVSGNYCSACGQRFKPPVPSLRDAVTDAASEVFTLDSVFLRTIRTLIVYPGLLSLAFVQGRQRRFIHPLRLFLQVGAGAYLISRFLPAETPIFGIGPKLFGPTVSWVDVGLAVLWVAIISTSHWLALRRRHAFLIEHVIFFLHVLTFSFFVVPVSGLLTAVSGENAVAATLTALFPPLAVGTYWILALSRFNDRTVRESLVDGFRVYGVILLFGAPFAIMSAIR